MARSTDVRTGRGARRFGQLARSMVPAEADRRCSEQDIRGWGRRRTRTGACGRAGVSTLPGLSDLRDGVAADPVPAARVPAPGLSAATPKETLTWWFEIRTADCCTKFPIASATDSPSRRSRR